MDFSEEEQTLPLKEDEASQKSYINLKIGNAHIPIEVKCLYRARFFQEQLQETFSAFISNKVIQEDLEAVGISLDNQVFPNLFKYLAAILDEQMIVCLDEEFGNDSSNKGITDLTAARKKYEDYFSKEINSTEEFSKRHAELFKTNRQVCKNFHNAQLLALKRIKNDIQLLKNSLLKNLVAPIKLKQISSSGSDFHKQGQQVLILTFSDKNKKIQKIIYKPSPLEADALLLGDIQQLAEFDPGFRDHFSLIELLNEGLGPQEKLPTYLIIPRKDGDLKDETVSRLNTYYGYLEYLSHDPWKEPDYENIISSCLEDPFLDYATPRKIQAKVNEKFKAFLIEASKDKNCDFIAQTPEEIERYSFDCGLLISLMMIAGINDNHCENLLIVGRRPRLIDAECCFSHIPPDIDRKVCFDINSGSMSKYSVITKTYDYLSSVQGARKIAIEHIEKNRFFHLYRKEGSELIACGPIHEVLINGFKKGLGIFNSRMSKLSNWFNLHCLKNMLVRVPLYETNEFKLDIDTLKKQNFSKEKYDELYLSRIKNELPKDKNFFVIYLDKDATTGILSEYCSLNVPVFYAAADKKFIYNSYGYIIKVPIDLKSYQTCETKNDFFKLSPLEYTQEKAIELLYKPNEIIKNVESTFQELDNLSEEAVDETASVFLKINLSETEKTATLRGKNDEGEKVSDKTPLLKNFKKDTDDPNNDQGLQNCGCRMM